MGVVSFLKKLKRKSDKMEFSKKIFIGVTFGVIVVTLFSFVLMWVTKDVSPLVYLIPAVYGAFMTAIGFYYNKAKAENQIKIQMEYKKLGIENFNGNEMEEI